MSETLIAPDLAALDFEPALRCDFEACQSAHGRSAEYRLLVEHVIGCPCPEHHRGLMLACPECYSWLVQHPSKIVACPEHGELGPVRSWWTLLGQV